MSGIEVHPSEIELQDPKAKLGRKEGSEADVSIERATILIEPRNLKAWLTAQLLTINLTNVALIIAVIAISANMQNSLNDQRVATANANVAIAQLQLANAEAAARLAQLDQRQSVIADFNSTLQWAVSSGLPNLVTFASDLSGLSRDSLALRNNVSSLHQFAAEVSGLGSDLLVVNSTIAVLPSLLNRLSAAESDLLNARTTLSQIANPLYVPVEIKQTLAGTAVGVQHGRVRREQRLAELEPCACGRAFFIRELRFHLHQSRASGCHRWLCLDLQRRVAAGSRRPTRLSRRLLTDRHRLFASKGHDLLLRAHGGELCQRHRGSDHRYGVTRLQPHREHCGSVSSNTRLEALGHHWISFSHFVICWIGLVHVHSSLTRGSTTQSTTDRALALLLSFARIRTHLVFIFSSSDLVSHFSFH